MISRNYLLSLLLECGYMDVDYLEGLICEYDIELDIDEIKQEFGKIHINLLIYKVYTEIKDKFLNDYEEEVVSITGMEIRDFEDYEIFTNCIDSHLWFTDERIQELFEKWKTEIVDKNCFVS